MSAVFAECIILMGAGTTRSFIHFTFYFPLHFSIPAGDLSDFLFMCVCVCVSFTLILLFSCPPLFISFHQGRTPTAPIQKASPVVLCLILSVCILPWAQVKPLSELDFKVKADVVVSDGIMRQILHVRTFTGSYTRYGFAELTPTPARAHTRQTSTRSALPSVLCCFIVLCHLPAFFMFPYVFPCSLWAGCKLQNLLLNENDD